MNQQRVPCRHYNHQWIAPCRFGHNAISNVGRLREADIV
ncbi:hypothetical protein PSNTI_13110 [Stutzerimonas stutzeri]|nr:hypothetical protein PSNTI_13110 [Stutzerimonas stutzeri]